MTKRSWYGEIAFVGIQTGDGRMIEPGALDYDMPQPLAWAIDGTQHSQPGDVPQIGVMETAEEADGVIVATGFIDDEIEEGAELIRRMEEGVASHEHRQAVSIDLNVEEVVLLGKPDEDGDEDDELVASVGVTFIGGRRETYETTTLQRRWQDEALLYFNTIYAQAQRLLAAAGDPEPDDLEEIARYRTDEYIEKVTAGSLAGLTAVATPAFIGAFIELVDVEDHEHDDDDEATTASVVNRISTDTWTITPGTMSRTVTVPLPDRSLFDDPHLDEPTRMLIDGRTIRGHAALWGQCHTAFDHCVVAPRGGDYNLFHSTGRIRCADDTYVGTGSFVWGIPHAELDQAAIDAFEHYEIAAHGFADVRVGEDEHGIWFAGLLRPSVNDDEIEELSRLSISGDWRKLPTSTVLSFIAGLAVNVPAFPIVDALSAAAIRARVAFDVDMHPLALVAAGVVPGPVSASAACTCGAGVSTAAEFGTLLQALLDGQEQQAATIATLLRRTASMIPAAVAAAAADTRRY